MSFAGATDALAIDDTVGQYQEAIRIAREGKPEQALPVLAEFAERFPLIARYRNDYILVLFWAGREAEVVEQAKRRNIDDMPLYVLESVASAARNQQQFVLAERAFRSMVRRDPAKVPYQLGLARVLIDQRKLSPATELLQSLEKRHGQQVDFLLVKAYLHEAEGDFLAAAALYQKVLEQRPGHQEAIRGMVLARSRVKAFELAYRDAEQYRQFFSEEEWIRLRWDLAAAWVRWGEIYPSEDEALRYREIDKAIGLIEDNLLYLDQSTLQNSSSWRSRARFDLMVALRDRKRMAEVLDQYRMLQEERVEIPAYAKIAAADAFLYLQQPEQARDLYLQVLEQIPGNFNVGQSLVFAYLEAEQPDLAEQLAEQLAQQQPDKLWYKHPKGNGLLYSEGNHEKTVAELATVRIANFTDRLEDAHRDIQTLYRNAPFNADIRDVRAHTFSYRGWPRQAHEQYLSALNIDPKHLGLRAGLSETLHDLREYSAEEANTLSLYALYPEEKNVQRRKRLWDIHNERELQVFSNGRFSSGSAQGSESISLDSFLYSQPLDYHYRLFTHVRWMTGKFGAGQDVVTGQNITTRGYYRRYGLGLEYAVPDLLATGELHYDNFARSTVGFQGSLNYQFDDFWSAGIAFDTRSDEIGLRALSVGRLSAPQAGSTRPATDGVTAYSIVATTSYRLHESRRFDAAYQFFDYSDGNVAGVLSTTWFERWITGPRYKMSTYLNLGTTFHSRMDGNYYHPKNDFGSSLTLDNELLTYRFYDLSFHQRLAFTIGQYWQKEKTPTANRFHWDPVGSIQYEHRWKARDRYELVYGAIRGYPVYDGNREETWRFYLNLNVRF